MTQFAADTTAYPRQPLFARLLDGGEAFLSRFDGPRLRIGLAALAGLIFLGALAGLIHLALRYPFYFIWDMDHITALDVLLINAGQQPDHLNHTGMGMYLLMRITSVLGALFGALDAPSMNWMETAANPLLPLAQLTDFLRLHSPIVLAATTLAAFISIRLISGIRIVSFAGVATLVVLMAQPWMTYHASFVRTEIYALFFWQTAILAFAVAGSVRKWSVQVMLALAAGVLLGLGLITKFQLLPYVAAFYVISKLALDVRAQSFAQLAAVYERRRLWFVGLNLAALGLFAILWLMARAYTLPTNYFILSTIAPTPYGPALPAVFFLVVCAGIFVMQMLRHRIAALRGLIGSHDLAMFSAVQFGFACSALTAMVVYTNLSSGWAMVLASFKVAFLRQFGGMGGGGALRQIAGNAIHWLQHHPVLALVIVLAMAALAFIAWRAPAEAQRRIATRSASWLILTACLYFAGSLMFRDYQRDAIWRDSLMIFLALLGLCIASTSARDAWPKWARSTNAALLAPCLLLLGASLAAFPAIAINRDINYNIYGWSPGWMFLQVYPGNQLRYGGLLAQRFPDQTIAPASPAGVALRQAVEWRRVLATARFVLPYQDVSLRDIAQATTGAPLFGAGGWVQSTAPEIDGAILIPLQDLAPRRARLLDANLVSVEAEVGNKITDQWASGQAGIVPRADLEIVLLTPAVPGAACDLSAVIVTGEGVAVNYCGEHVTVYTETDPASGGIVAVRPRFGW